MSRRTHGCAALIAASCVLVATGCKAPSDETQTATIASPIVGGAASNDLLAVGFLNVANLNGCSGVLIAPNVVLTAAHCFETFYRSELAEKPPVWFFTGAVGSTAPIRAARVVVHPDTQCLFTKTGRDLAYIVLSEAVKGIEPLGVERARHTAHCEYTDVGYGSAELLYDAGGESDGGSGFVPGPLCEASETRPASSLGFREGDEPIVPIRQRKALVACADEALTTSGYIGSRSEAGSTCIGDSGSPLIDMRTKKIVGIVSGGVISEAGVQCEANSKSIYTPVFDRMSFIEEALAAGTSAVAADAGPQAEPTEEGCSAAPRDASTSEGAIPRAASVLSVLALSWFVLGRRKRPA